MRITVSTPAGITIGAALLLATTLILAGCKTRLPDIKAQLLLEFGKYMPPEREQVLIQKAGGLYALGYRRESTGRYTVRAFKDQLYDRDHNLTLDLYLPSGAKRPYPLVVLVHGGGWQYFSKVSVSGYAKMLASQGFAAVGVDYRLTNVVPWPAQLTDLRKAVAWLQANSAELGLDFENWAVMGDSAGGHLAAMLAVAPGNGLHPKAAIGYYGVYDLCALVERDPAKAAENPINQLLGVPPGDIDASCRMANPVSWVDNTTPSFLLIHGTDDSLVPMAQTQAMAAILQKNNVPVETIYVSKADHLLLGLPEQISPSLLEIDQAVLDFLRRKLSVSYPPVSVNQSQYGAG